MRLRKHHLPLVAMLGLAIAVAAALAVTQAAVPSITAVDPYSWQANGTSPAAVAIMAGGEVKFSYPSGASHHYPVLQSGPGAAPNCTNIPTTFATSGPGWSGSCTFSQAGTYTFYCGVHGSLMTATVTVTSAGQPTAVTESATQVGEAEATLNGTVNPNGHPTMYFFRYGTTTSYGKETSMSGPIEGTANVSVSAQATGLQAGTTYHFQLVAKNANGTVEGADQTFITPGPPTAITGAAASVGETGATLRGTVNPDGHPTTYLFRYGTTTSYGKETSVSSPIEGTAEVPVSIPVTGLAAGTTYHYQLVAKNEKGTVEGADRAFTTLSPPKEPPKEEPPAKEPSPTPTPAPVPAPGPVSPQPELAPLLPPLIQGSLKLTAPRHGSSVGGSVEVSPSGAGWRLEVDLVAKSASLARRSHPPKQVTVGRLVRGSVPAGKVSFSVSLNARAKAALRRHRRLAITVRVVLTSPSHEARMLTRGVVLRA
jgi:plastocyanin